MALEASLDEMPMVDVDGYTSEPPSDEEMDGEDDDTNLRIDAQEISQTIAQAQPSDLEYLQPARKANIWRLRVAQLRRRSRRLKSQALGNLHWRKKLFLIQNHAMNDFDYLLK